LTRRKLPLSWVFAIAGLDVESIGSKSLLGFSLGLRLIIELQMFSSTEYFHTSICSGWTINKYPAIANTFSLA
jgi:hypothetical protein